MPYLTFCELAQFSLEATSPMSFINTMEVSWVKMRQILGPIFSWSAGSPMFLSQIYNKAGRRISFSKKKFLKDRLSWLSCVWWSPNQTDDLSDKPRNTGWCIWWWWQLTQSSHVLNSQIGTRHVLGAQYSPWINPYSNTVDLSPGGLCS